MIIVNKNPKIYVHKYDLPDKITQECMKSSFISIDTETMGLKLGRDRLCLVQLTFNDEDCHLIQFNADDYACSKNLISILENKNITKLFHFARFDCGILYETFNVMPINIYCTKIASKLARTYTDRHGLKTICNELLGVEISKKEQSSDWGKTELSENQKHYAAMDVIFLNALREKLDIILIRENRMDLAATCFKSLDCIIKLDNAGWSENLFAHI